MQRLFDQMFLKRFCLPSNSDISNYENGDLDVNSCLCGNYNHIACVFKGKDR